MTQSAVEPYAQLGGLPEPLPPAIPITVPAVQNQQVFTGRCILTGWSLQNTSAAADFAVIYDGGSAAGQKVGVSRTAAGNTDTEHCGPSGVLVQNGLYVAQSVGTIAGTLWVIPL